jgi:hypothetical protein
MNPLHGLGLRGAHIGQFRSEEDPRDLFESARVARGEELVAWRRGLAPLQVAVEQRGVHILGGLFGRGDQHHTGAQLALEQPGQQRVMRAAKDQGVDVGSHQRRKIPARGLS